MNGAPNERQLTPLTIVFNIFMRNEAYPLMFIGRVYNRFQARPATFPILIKELLNAEYTDFVTNLKADMKYLMNRFSNSCSKFELEIIGTKF